jgi:hypothetical protein
MTTAEKIYKVVKELPESMRQEVLDFVDFLKQKTIPDEPQSGNLAILIHNRFNGLDADNLPVPPRQLFQVAIKKSFIRRYKLFKINA